MASNFRSSRGAPDHVRSASLFSVVSPGQLRLRRAQFLDWSKAPFPGQYIFEYYRRLAEADEQRRKPQPTKTVFAKGCMEWFAEQKNSG
jgi:hypothetical protein